MKNVHVLPTEKETRLFTSDSELILAGYPKTTFKTGKNIYITDDSEIEVGDWFLCLDNTKCNDSTYKCNEVWLNMEEKQPSYCKKIILTTDTDLIADGVQAIDDEFLEWFVQNPTCEVVRVGKIELNTDYRSNWKQKFNYEIILPQDEAKQETERGLIIKKSDGSIINQETLEEAAIRLLYSKYPYHPPQDGGYWQDMFIAGAKWQTERMYSEEEVKQIIDATLIEYSDYVLADIPEWFEQFKKQKS